ncbi:hypothetical protein RKD45_005740 [Streptomyces griseus]
MTKRKNLKKGESVSWQSHGHSVQGKVKRKITERTEAAGRTVDASKDEPQYEVESDRTRSPGGARTGFAPQEGLVVVSGGRAPKAR